MIPPWPAVKEMAKRDIHRIIVLDGNSKLAGIVTPMDIVRAVARGESFAPIDD